MPQDIAGKKMISCFARSPNSLGYCGKESASNAFVNCLAKDCCDQVMSETKNFIVLMPYLRTLSKILKKPESDIDVVEAYWLGNKNLKKIKQEHYSLLLEMFRQQGVPDWLIKELSEKAPKKFIPTHLFQVLHVGVGRASGSVPYNLETINNCMIRWGKVVEIQEGQVKIKLNSLKTANIPYQLCKLDSTIPFNKFLVDKITVGCVVAVHWNQVVRVLSTDETKRLAYWTKEVLNSF